MGSKFNAGEVQDWARLRRMAATGLPISRLLFRRRLFRNISRVTARSARRAPGFWPYGQETHISVVLLLSPPEAPQLSRLLRPKARSRYAGEPSTPPLTKLVFPVAMAAFTSALQILWAEASEIWWR
jgi:hypothetical protein